MNDPMNFKAFKKKAHKIISIPHLHRTRVFLLDMKYLRGIEIKGPAYTCRMSNDDIVVCLVDIEKSLKSKRFVSILAHEFMHVIQHLCEQFCMTIEEEREHTAYIMGYLMDEALS